MIDHTVKVSTREAMLIDWVLTLHTYDREYSNFLMKSDIQRLRCQVGRIIKSGEGELDLSEEEIRWLLTILPISFRFGKEDVGFSLKRKLCRTCSGKRPGFHSALAGVAEFLSARMRFAKHDRVKPADSRKQLG